MGLGLPASFLDPGDVFYIDGLPPIPGLLPDVEPGVDDVLIRQLAHLLLYCLQKTRGEKIRRSQFSASADLCTYQLESVVSKCRMSACSTAGKVPSRLQEYWGLIGLASPVC